MANHAVQDFGIDRAKEFLIEMEAERITAGARERIVFASKRRLKCPQEFHLEPLV
jgi:hypothetical protein